MIQQQNAEELLAESEFVQSAIRKIYTYWGGYWYATKSPATFSVYGETTRTNNDVESWNRWFNARCHGHRQNLWDFICKILKLLKLCCCQ